MLEAEAKFTYLFCSWRRLASSVVMVTSGMRVNLHPKARHSSPEELSHYATAVTNQT